MKIKLNSLKLLNFKGLKNIEIQFNDQTRISGDNATGKTTIMDAFIWLLFGKDSTDRKDFEIKTLDKDNKCISKIDHEVTGILNIDNREVKLTRILKEKWTKKRGSEDAEFTGHETLFYCDEVPMQAKEFQAKIDSIMNEQVFKMVTSPHYFNSMKWQDRRSVLMSIAGQIEDIKVFDSITTLQNKSEILNLTNLLNQGKSIDALKTMIAAKKKKIKDDLSLIPARIDEVNRSIPEQPNYKELELELTNLIISLQKVENSISDVSKANQVTQENRMNLQNEFYSLQRKAQQIEFNAKIEATNKNNEAKSGINDLQNSLISKQRTASELQKSREYFQKSISGYNSQADTLRAEWNTENAKTIEFIENEFTCPTCKRPFEAEDIQAKKAEMTSSFNNAKVLNLNSITEKGQAITIQKQQSEVEIKKVQEQLTVLYSEIESIQSDIEKLKYIQLEIITPEDILSENKDYAELNERITELKGQLEIEVKPEVLDSLKFEKTQISGKIDLVKKDLNIRDTVVKANERIAELNKEMKSLSSSLSELEKTEFTIEEFTKAKMNLVESRVNSMFQLVKFKMFNTLINGGIEETCETLIDGVPYSDLNNAAKINAGRDIVNTLSDYYNVSAPCFVDNAESINELLPIKSQDIRLIVTKDQQLKVA
jgi:exonuclease SbcC